jgi:hypothetical protein
VEYVSAIVEIIKIILFCLLALVALLAVLLITVSLLPKDNRCGCFLWRCQSRSENGRTRHGRVADRTHTRYRRGV